MTSLTPNMDKARGVLAEKGMDINTTDPIERMINKILVAMSEAAAYEADIGTSPDIVFDGYSSAAASLLMSTCATLGQGNKTLAKAALLAIVSLANSGLSENVPDAEFDLEIVKGRPQ